MNEETKKTTEEELTRRHFLKGGAGAVLVVSCLLALDLPETTTNARASQNEAVASAIIPGGERLTLPSKILGENRTVFVSLPASYPQGVQSYPVLYLTDAQWNFDHTRATAAFLARNRIIPEMIVVGVTNPDRTRDLYATRADFKHNGRTIPFSPHSDLTPNSIRSPQTSGIASARRSNAPGRRRRRSQATARRFQSLRPKAPRILKAFGKKSPA